MSSDQTDAASIKRLVSIVRKTRKEVKKYRKYIKTIKNTIHACNSIPIDIRTSLMSMCTSMLNEQAIDKGADVHCWFYFKPITWADGHSYSKSDACLGVRYHIEFNIESEQWNTTIMNESSLIISTLEPSESRDEAKKVCEALYRVSLVGLGFTFDKVINYRDTIKPPMLKWNRRIAGSSGSSFEIKAGASREPVVKFIFKTVKSGDKWLAVFTDTNGNSIDDPVIGRFDSLANATRACQVKLHSLLESKLGFEKVRF